MGWADSHLGVELEGEVGEVELKEWSLEGGAVDAVGGGSDFVEGDEHGFSLIGFSCHDFDHHVML